MKSPRSVARPLVPGTALAMALLVGGCTGAPAPSTAAEATEGVAAAPAAAPSVAPEQVRVALETTREPRGDGMVDWRAAWVMTWEPVPGADGYVAEFATSEGRGGRESPLEEPLLRVDAAAGTSTAERLEQDQAAQLSFSASQLLVSVAATGADGAEGPATPWYHVGDAPADGVPVPGTAPEGHDDH